MTLSKLQLVTDNFAKGMNFKKPKIVWKKYINKIFQGIKKFDADQEVLISNVDYLKKMSIFLTEHQYNIGEFMSLKKNDFWSIEIIGTFFFP